MSRRGKARRSTSRARPSQRGKVAVVIPAGQPDHTSLLSAGREWLVPLLVRDFLLERGIEPFSPEKANKNDKRNYGMPLQGARDITRGLN